MTSTETLYDEKRKSRIQKQLKTLGVKENDKETVELVESHLKRLDPYCYPYNATVAFAEIYIDTMDILVNYILNGDGRKVFNRFSKMLRPNPQKFYDTIHPRAAGRFYNLTNVEVAGAMVETLHDILEQCKEWKITFDIGHYKHLLTSIDYTKFLCSDAHNSGLALVGHDEQNIS